MRKVLGLLLFLVAAAPLAHARDIVAFGRTEWIAANDEADDIVCAFCTIHVDGPVRGDIVTAFSHVEFGPKVDVSGDAVTAFTHMQFNGDNHVNGDMVTFGSDVESEGSLTVQGDRVSMPPAVAWLILIAPFAILALIVWGITRIFQRRRYAYRPPAYPGSYVPRP